MKTTMLNTEQRRDMIEKTAEKHERMFVGKFVEQMFAGLGDGEDEEGSGIFAGKYGNTLIKPALVDALAGKISSQFNMRKHVAEAMFRKEGIKYDRPTFNVAA